MDNCPANIILANINKRAVYMVTRACEAELVYPPPCGSGFPPFDIANM